MKTFNLILILCLFFLQKINAQNAIYSNFPAIESENIDLDAEELLEELNWEAIVKFCDTTEGQHASVNQTEDLTSYHYIKQGYKASFILTTFQGKVLDYRSHKDKVFRTSYFNRELWIEYTKLNKDFRDSDWLFSEEEMSELPNEVIQSYYTLLGFNARDEYGWICEYSAAGFPPDKRLAVVNLINYKKRALLLKLLDHPNTQTKLYAADALIYLDMIGEIRKVELAKLKKKKKRRYKLTYNQDHQLSKKEWRKIHKIRDDQLAVITCGNMGSYKQYKSTTSELLSIESINEIYDNYHNLKRMGYLQ